MAEDIKKEWLLDENEAPKDDLPTLGDINEQRQEESDIESVLPPPPLPVAQESSPSKTDPVEPITEKEFAKLLENVVKYSGDANVSLEKCITNLNNVLAKIDYAKDMALEPKVKEHLEKANEIKKELELLNNEVSGYRKSTIEGK